MKLLCRDGSVQDINLDNLDEKCAIIATVNSEVVSKTTNKGNADYKEILLKMDNVFGTSSEEDTMNMYAKFRDTDNLMFKVKCSFLYQRFHQNNRFSFSFASLEQKIFISQHKKVFVQEKQWQIRVLRV